MVINRSRKANICEASKGVQVMGLSRVTGVHKVCGRRCGTETEGREGLTISPTKVTAVASSNVDCGGSYTDQILRRIQEREGKRVSRR